MPTPATTRRSACSPHSVSASSTSSSHSRLCTQSTHSAAEAFCSPHSPTWPGSCPRLCVTGVHADVAVSGPCLLLAFASSSTRRTPHAFRSSPSLSSCEYRARFPRHRVLTSPPQLRRVLLPWRRPCAVHILRRGLPSISPRGRHGLGRRYMPGLGSRPRYHVPSHGRRSHHHGRLLLLRWVRLMWFAT